LQHSISLAGVVVIIKVRLVWQRTFTIGSYDHKRFIVQATGKHVMRHSCQNDDRKKFVRRFENGKLENGTKIEKKKMFSGKETFLQSSLQTFVFDFQLFAVFSFYFSNSKIEI
jgi:hypothetical protein